MRAGGITAAGLIAGAVVGSALQSWLRVDIVPIGVSALLALMHSELTVATVRVRTAADSRHIISHLSERALDQAANVLLVVHTASIANKCLVHRAVSVKLGTHALKECVCVVQSFSSPGIFVGEFALIGLWAAAAFLA